MTEGTYANIAIPPEFVKFPSIPRLSRPMVVTEKIDGTNASIYVPEDGSAVIAGSRSRWIYPWDDNFGFARWVNENAEALRVGLGFGHHYGEWWGPGIQRGYCVATKRFSLFNVKRWQDVALPEGVYTVPVLYEGPFSTEMIATLLAELRAGGSKASPGFMRPEGVVVYHTQGRTLFKKTLDKDDAHKGE